MICVCIKLGLLTALMRLCHTSTNSAEEVLTRLAFWVHAGHMYSGMDSIAMEGASNVNVPPWRIGSLKIKRASKRSGGGEGTRAKQIKCASHQEKDFIQLICMTAACFLYRLYLMSQQL